MKTSTTVIIGTLAMLGGIAAVIAADRLGWLRHDDAAVNQDDHAPANPPAPFAIRPRADSSEARIVPASEVREIELQPRAQRPASATCTNAQKTVVFDDASVANAAGIRWRAIATSPVTNIIHSNVEIDFDGNRLAHVSSRAAGVVQQVLKQSGDAVKSGEALALIDSSDLGGAKAALLQAGSLVRLWTQNLEQLKSVTGGAVTQQELMEAETHLAEAQIDLASATQRLRNLGLDAQAVQHVADENDTSSTLPVRAPFDGVVIERHAVQGEVIDTQAALFTIADTSSMWAILDVREGDIRNVKAGQRVQVSLSAAPDVTHDGTIDWISAAVDETTRTLKARARLDNSSNGADGAMRAHMFGRAQIIASDQEAHLIVPHDAVQWDGCCNLVFVRQTDSIFQPFKVRLGADLGEQYVVLDGLREGDEIVTGGGFLLKTQLLKDSIGAGCCEEGGIKKE